MKYSKILNNSKNTWTCKCGNFYHRTTKYCSDCYKGNILFRIIRFLSRLLTIK